MIDPKEIARIESLSSDWHRPGRQRQRQRRLRHRTGNDRGSPDTCPAANWSSRPATSADFRNADGEIKRQAARFRIYAHMRDGSVQEVTAASGAADRMARRRRQSQGGLVRIQSGDGSGAAQPRREAAESRVVDRFGQVAARYHSDPQEHLGTECRPC